MKKAGPEEPAGREKNKHKIKAFVRRCARKTATPDEPLDQAKLNNYGAEGGT